jgi:hypothetical protein
LLSNRYGCKSWEHNLLLSKLNISSKIQICCCYIDSKEMVFVINSENREHYHCLPISKQNHDFLKHDSFISCSNFFEYGPDTVEKIVGNLSKSEKDTLRCHLSSSRTISKINKEIILNELG